MNTLKFGNGEWYGKKDTILAYNDENSNFKPLPFSFDRDTSATRVNKDGLIETVGSGEPRIDYKDDSKGALKLEPSRSNVALYSEDFSNGVYSKINGTVTTNTAISPDGTQNADTWTATSSSANLQGVVSVTSGVQYTMSIYLKRKTGTGQVSLRGVSNTSTNITITDEWQRYSVTLTSTDTNGRYGVLLLNSGDEVYVWGAQLEQGSYATSYIPTQGGVVTRNQDSCSQTPPSGVIGQTEGTMFLDFNIDDISLQTQDPVLMYLKNSSGITSYFEMYDNGNFVVVHINSGSITLTKNGLTDGRHKAAFAYKDNDFAFYVDGTLAGTNTNFTVASSQTEVGLQYTSPLYIGKQLVNDMKLYNTRLSNAELQALTTI